MNEVGGESTPTIRDYLNVFRRRKWIIIQAVVLLPLAATLFAMQQQSLYSASAQVLLSQENQIAQLTGTPVVSGSEDPVRFAQTQASLAQTPAVASRVLKAAHVEGNPNTFFAHATIKPDTNTDLLSFTVTNHDPALAVRLVNAYVEEFTLFRRQLDTAAIHKARSALQKRLQVLSKGGHGASTLYASLADRDEQLATAAALQSANTAVVREASAAGKIQPRPKKYALLGLMLGLIIGLGLALLWEAVDTRVRSGDEVAKRLDAPLLARIPSPSRGLRGSETLAMLADPGGPQSEVFRMLRTNLDFTRLDRKAKTLMVTSAIEKEGKSTTIANLALAIARSGQRVVIVDLDLRRPYLDRFFKIEDRPGLTNVALGDLSLEEALTPISLGLTPLPDLVATNGHGQSNGNGSSGNGSSLNGHGALWVLTSGPIPPDTGEFVGKHFVGDILRALEEKFEVVLVDAPPVLLVGDAMTLSSQVDGLIVVARANVLRRGMLTELRRALENSRSPVLGVVLTGSETETGRYSRYSGYYRYYTPHSDSKRVEEKVRS